MAKVNTRAASKAKESKSPSASKKKSAPAPAPVEKKTTNTKKVTKKATKPAPEKAVAESNVEATASNVLSDDDEEALRKQILGDLVSSSEGEDSSDDEVQEDTFEANKNVIAISNKKLEQSKLETKAKFDKRAPKTKPVSSEPGILYIGRIPHGFYEEQMKVYFSQFGEVTRLRLSRNKKTGKSKHYGFIEFASKEVAEIVADTMDNYLLLGRLLQCKMIPAERVHENMFDGANKTFKVIPWAQIDRVRRSQPKTEEQKQKIAKRLRENDEKRRKRLKESGIDYDFPGYA